MIMCFNPTFFFSKFKLHEFFFLLDNTSYNIILTGIQKEPLENDNYFIVFHKYFMNFHLKTSYIL